MFNIKSVFVWQEDRWGQRKWSYIEANFLYAIAINLALTETIVFKDKVLIVIPR